MKLVFIIILSLLQFCSTTKYTEISGNKYLSNENYAEFSELKSRVECNVCNPTEEEIDRYYKLKNEGLVSEEKIRKYHFSKNSDSKSKILVLNPESNNFLEKNFKIGSRNVELPSFLNGRQKSPALLRNNFYDYRMRKAPITVKPGHQF